MLIGLVVELLKCQQLLKLKTFSFAIKTKI